jgi:hypothetical protein
MTALSLLAASRNDTFAARVGFISMDSAIAVATENPATTDHAARVAWAYKVLRGEQNNKIVAAAIIAASSTIQTTINATPLNYGSDVADGTIETALNSVITALGQAVLAA